MDFIARLNIYIAELKALGKEEELALADNLQNCVKEYLDEDQTINLIKHDDRSEEGEVVEIGEIIGEEEGELLIKEEEEGEISIKEEIYSNDDSKAKMFHTMQKISEKGHHKHRFLCSDCQKELRSLSRFVDHKRIIHGIADFNEEIKTRVINLMKNQLEKVKLEHMMPVLSCKYCSFTKSIETLSQDIQKKISNNILIRSHIQNEHMMCEVCEIAFNDNFDLIEHIESHNPDEGVYLCNYKGCTRSENTFSLVFSHAQKVHHTVRLYKCNKCTESCASMDDLTKHFKQHIGYKLDNNSCPLCALSYPGWGRLKTHIKKAHKNICNVCERIFKHTSVLFEHMKEHTEKKANNLVCLECNKLFPSLNVLKKHMLSFSHTGRKYFSCELCKKGFSSKNKIAIHMQTKGWSRCKKLPKVDYIKNCTECGKKSKSRSGWLRHMKITHSKYTSFSCETCKKILPTETALTRHMSKIGGMRCDMLQEIKTEGMC